jgi:hypothetical protein
MTYDSTTKAVAFTATGGLVTIAYIKGGSGYNIYDYSGFAGGGVAWDGHLHAPDTNNDGNVQGLSHAIFCTGEGTEPSPSPTQEEEDITDAPSASPTEGVPDVTPSPTFNSGQEDITEAPTDALGNSGGNSPANGAWLLVIGLGVLLASIVVLTPARAKSKR